VRLAGDKGLIVLLDNTSQGRFQNDMVRGIESILFGQPYDFPKRSIAETIANTIAEKNVAAAVQQYRELKTAKPKEYDFSEPELNTLGYQLLGQGKTQDAIEIFKLNVEAYPQGFNTYDSLGDAYKRSGDKDLAIANYKKSLELNPKNLIGAEALAALTSNKKEVKVDSSVYDSYAGEYELGPNFIVTITNENGKLMGQPTNQPKAELFPTSDTEFFLKLVDAQVTFVKDEQGKVTKLILHQNGRNMEAKKVR